MNTELILEHIDQQVKKAFSQDNDLDSLPIADWQKYLPGFFERTNKQLKLEKIQQSLSFKPIQQEVKKSADFQGFVIGIMLEPSTPENPDLHGQWISAEEVEKSCLHWSRYHQRIGFNHNQWSEKQGPENPDAICLWNWIEYGSPVIGGYQVRPGTWLQAWQFISEEKKRQVQNYEINSFSPGGMATVIKNGGKDE